MKKAADYFKIEYHTIFRHLDSKTASKQNGQLVYFFTKELSSELYNELLNSLIRANNSTSEVWVYKKYGNKLILINENKPTFASMIKASKELGISNKKKITQILHTHVCYKELVFYNEKLQ